MTKFYKILDAVTAWIRFVERITDARLEWKVSNEYRNYQTLYLENNYFIKTKI